MSVLSRYPVRSMEQVRLAKDEPVKGPVSSGNDHHPTVCAKLETNCIIQKKERCSVQIYLFDNLYIN